MTAPELPPPEFSRPVDIRQADGLALALVANADERAALALRFALVRIDRLEANLVLVREGATVGASGTLSAAFVQSCAVSDEDLPVMVEEPVTFRFVPESAGYQPDEEVELDEGDLDEIEYVGTAFDLGEAVAQSLALAIDPFATGPGAEAARELLKGADANPFAALKRLNLKD